jgi:hypothetical protein
MALRKLKEQVSALLRADDLQVSVSALAAWPPRQVVNPLIGLLYHGDPRVRWHAVTAMGMVVARLAEAQMEAARVVMRRLMWSLNDESGGIGWGAPEAMGEIMACHERLAQEYAAILISYLNPHGNFLEHEGLQLGLLWGMGRLAHARPALTADAAPFIRPFLFSSRDDLRGMAVWAAGPLMDPTLREPIQALCADPAMVTLFIDGRFIQCTIGQLARTALG